MAISRSAAIKQDGQYVMCTTVISVDDRWSKSIAALRINTKLRSQLEYALLCGGTLAWRHDGDYARCFNNLWRLWVVRGDVESTIVSRYAALGWSLGCLASTDSTIVSP